MQKTFNRLFTSVSTFNDESSYAYRRMQAIFNR